MVPVDLLNYQLIRLIGSGGMGEVYLARNKNIDQYVAVKVLHPKYANNPLLRARFKQEAVMLNSLNHPNIVKFLNFVENENGVFLIMEYVEGYTLEEFISKKNGLIVEDKAYPMMCEILEAFSYAHQRGIIHRDIKPSNIFLDKEGHIKVMDFGIAQILSEVNGQQGGPSSMGTPAYMSPEQVYGQQLSQRSDIYSLGVLFHQMLTGRAPYDSTTMSELEIKKYVVNENLPRMKNYYPYISEGLQTVVDKATAKKADDRYASCEEMLKAIRRVMEPEKKSRTPLYIAAAVLSVIALLGVGVWDYARTKVSYYKDYAEFYGVPKGIGSLSKKEVEHRDQSYRMESSRWKVRRVTLVNSKGKTIGHTDTEHMNSRFADTYYYYSDNGNIDYKKVYDQYGKLLYKIDYDENLKVAMFKYDDEHGTAKRLQGATTKLTNVNPNDRSSITRYLLTYNDKGLLEQMEYASGEDNTPVGDDDYIYGQAFDYDDKGRVTEVRFLGQDGEVRGNKIGLAIKQYEYDDNDNWTVVRYLTAEGKPSHDGNNCPLVEIEYDKWGNRIAERYYTIEGKPAYRTDVMACGFAYEHNDEGLVARRILIDGNGDPTIGRDGYAQVAFTYNDDGFCTEMEFQDKDGNRAFIVNEDGDLISIIRTEMDDKGLELSREFFDIQDKPMETVDGVHKFTYDYDSVGNMTKVKFFDKRDKPAPASGFNSGVKYTYNDKYLCVSMSYIDKDGHLTYNDDGMARCKKTYDRTGNVTKYEYIDTDGKTLVNSRWGFAVEEVTYDALGNQTAIMHYNSAMEPCMTTYGYSKTEYVYDEKTNFTTEVKYYDAKNGIIKTEHYEYDSHGNRTKEWTTDKRGQLDGVVENNEFNKNNKNTKLYYTNLQGTRVNAPGEQYCEVRAKYDDRGNVTEQTYFSTSGEPAVDGQKTHKRIRKYDERNNYVYEKNLDKEGKPIQGTSVNPEARMTYDDHGNLTSITCLDGNGGTYVGTEGYHRMERKYNESNLLETECYKNKDGILTTHKTKEYAKVNYAYNKQRRTTEEKYFDANNKVIFYITYTYNDRNNMTEACIFNANGKPDDSRYYFSRITVEYADDGITPTKKTYYRAGRVLAWQRYDAKTGEWGELNF